MTAGSLSTFRCPPRHKLSVAKHRTNAPVFRGRMVFPLTRSSHAVLSLCVSAPLTTSKQVAWHSYDVEEILHNTLREGYLPSRRDSCFSDPNQRLGCLALSNTVPPGKENGLHTKTITADCRLQSRDCLPNLIGDLMRQ